MARVIVLSGGGTGGHIFPALALADAIRADEPDTVVRFLATERGLGIEPFLRAGYSADTVPSAPVLGRGPVQKLSAGLALARGTWRARGLLRRANASLVIGVGGYASVPAVAAAATLRLPTALLEADAVPGRANQLLARFAHRVFVQFEDARAHFPPGRAVLTGFPVRPIPPHEAAREPGLRLLVIGGSQGARSINRAMAQHLRELDSLGLRITHQTGPADLEEVRTAYEEAGVKATVAAFFDDLPQRLAAADLVVARAGSSVAEFCVAGLPQVLVPYPHAAGGHQAHNARELERAGAALVIPDAEVGERLGEEVRALVADEAGRAEMARAARERARPDAARRIWQACLELLES